MISRFMKNIVYSSSVFVWKVGRKSCCIGDFGVLVLCSVKWVLGVMFNGVIWLSSLLIVVLFVLLDIK